MKPQALTKLEELLVILLEQKDKLDIKPQLEHLTSKMSNSNDEVIALVKAATAFIELGTNATLSA